MRQVAAGVLVAAVAAVGVMMFAGRAREATAAPAPFERRWEYAALRFKMLTGGKWEWRTPTESRIEDKLSIYRGMGGEGHTDGNISYIDIATQAGHQGWDVLTVLEREGGTEVWFKRQAR